MEIKIAIGLCLLCRTIFEIQLLSLPLLTKFFTDFQYFFFSTFIYLLIFSEFLKEM
jgi:hypothetical protein